MSLPGPLISQGLRSAGGTGMDPILLSTLISSGGSLLKGLFGGIAKKQERKQQFQDWEKMRDRQISDVNRYLKPEQPFYQTPYLPGIDRVLAQAILGNLGQRFQGGKLGNWGINLDDLRSSMQLDVPFAESQQAQKYYQPKPTTSMPRSPYLGRRFGADTFDRRRDITPDRFRRMI